MAPLALTRWHGGGKRHRSCRPHPVSEDSMRPLIRSAFLFTVLLGSVPACGSPPAATPAAPATVADEFAPAQLRADFRHLYAQLQASHYDLFARRPRGEYDALFEEMLASLDRPLDREAARRRFQRFVAFGNVAHASIAASAAGWETFRAGGGKAFPLFLRVVGDKAYVADDYSGVGTITQGMRVLAIDSQPVLDWLVPLRAQVSADTDYLAYAQMEMRLPMLVWEQHGARDDFLVELAGEGGAPVRITVPTRDRAGFEAEDAARGERFDPDWNARETRMLDDGIAYLRPGPFYDNRPGAEHPWDPAAFTAFVDDAFAGFIAAGA